MYKHHTRLDLVSGGNIFKQGDEVTLGFIPRYGDGAVIDLTGKTITGKIYSSRKGVIYEAPAAYDSGSQTISFAITETLDYGEFQIEFIATGTDFKMVLPSDKSNGRIDIKPSSENMDYVGVSMTTVAQLRTEQEQKQQQFELAIVPQVDELKQRVEEGIGAFTEDTEVKDARMGETNLRQFNEKTMAQLADTLQSAGKPQGHNVWSEFQARNVNVIWFGAVADADYYDETNKLYYSDATMTEKATDNAAAFQAAVDYLHSIGGGTLHVPPGKYVFRTNVHWKSTVSMTGAGVANTIFYTEGYIFNLFINLDGPHDGANAQESDFLTDVNFEGFQCDLIGLTKTEWDVNGKAFFILHMKRARFHNLLLKNTIGTALGCDFLVDTVISNVVVHRAGRNVAPGQFAAGNSGIGVGTDAYEEETLVISNCHTYDCGNYGIFVETQEGTEIRSKYAKVIGCHSQGNRLGYGNKGSGGTQFIGCSASDNFSHGFHLTQKARGDQLIGCVSERNGGDGVRVEADYVGDLELASVRLLNNVGAGLRALTSVNMDGLQNVLLNGVQSKENGLSGVIFEGGVKGLLINALMTLNNGQVSTSSNRGLLITGTNENVSVVNSMARDSQVTSTQKAGFQVQAGTTGLLLDGNSAPGYGSTAAFQIAAADPVIGTNKGLVTQAGGKAVFPEGIKTLYINHYLGQPPSSFVVTPTGNNAVWVIDNTEPNRTRVERASATGTLDIYWRASR